MCLYLSCGGVGDVGRVVLEWVGVGVGVWSGPWSGRLDDVMSVRVMSLDYLCRCHVQVSVYCARQIPAHRRCTQCAILLHLIDICFLPCSCLWQISQVQTCLRVVIGPELVSTSPDFK